MVGMRARAASTAERQAAAVRVIDTKQLWTMVLKPASLPPIVKTTRSVPGVTKSACGRRLRVQS